jgi:plastocyanin
MKMKSHFLTALTFVAALQLAQAADVTGKITLKGTPPAERPIEPLKNDQNCGKLVQGTPTTHFFVVGSDGALADVVVTLKGDSLKGKSTGAAAKPLLIDQAACEYHPYVTAVQTGQKITVRNSDPVMHNVHPAPIVAGNKEANKAQMPKAPDLEFSFDNPESFLKFRCDVHPWMLSYVTVVDHPYFAVTGKDGTFKIANVPPGKYTVEAIHRKGAPTGVTKEIEVKDQNVSADLTIELK